MDKLPNNLPDLLKKAGLTVVEIDGWQARCRPASTGSFNPVGVLNHHTGSQDGLRDGVQDKTYAEWLGKTGRSDLPPPLVQLSLSAEGVVYVIAAGRSNHAGVAKPSGSVAGGDGNSLYVGIEWMLSGTQPIPADMYKAGATLNAVLLTLMGSSVQAVSCHYQTSVTGKWDIGDPSGIEFQGHHVLNVPKFRNAVQQELDHMNNTTPHGISTLSIQHTSMQFSDPKPLQQSDADRVLSRGMDICTGTEAGPGNEVLRDALAASARHHGYDLFIHGDCWVAVKSELIVGQVDTGFELYLKSSEIHGQNTDKGVTWMTFKHKDLGTVTIGAGHYPTKGRHKGEPNYQANLKLTAGIGEWARQKGAGSAVVFYCGDQNIVDVHDDTFFGSPLTSAWDELDHYENTGHGNIDVIASYDKDGRVKANYCRAIDDKTFHLNTDHFLVEAGFNVRKLK